MQVVNGHRIYTVQDLLNELAMLDPNYEVGFASGSVAAFSLQGIVKHYENTVHFSLYPSYIDGVMMLGPIKEEDDNGTA